MNAELGTDYNISRDIDINSDTVLATEVDGDLNVHRDKDKDMDQKADDRIS